MLLLAAVPGAQLDLPSKPKAVPRSPGSELAPPGPPRGDLAASPGEPLDLPRPPGVPETGPLPVPPASGPEEAARELFRGLAKEHGTANAARALEQLLALGPAVVPVARAELGGSNGVVLSVAARVCLSLGDSSARLAVAERLTQPLPAVVAEPLLAELALRDPMLSSPEYLAGLLEHSTASMRTAASAALAARMASVPLSLLVPPLESKRTATRAATLELLARSSDPLAWNLIASRLGDSNAQLARSAAELLADIAEAEPLLVERAFPPEVRPGPVEWDRPRAYALLALVQREERTSQTLLEGADVAARIESLLGGLRSAQPLVAGACAVGLARLGFRVGKSQVGPWLDREVPHQLVRCGTGAEFHADFSSLERPALRALALLTGEPFGSDGEAWRRWWVENAGTFRASHAVIELGPTAASELLVSFLDAEGHSWSLIGAGREPGANERVLRLDAGAAERLVARLEEAGVFGARRIPNGSRVARGHGLVVAVGDQEKRFERSAKGDAAWLEGLRSGLQDLRDGNIWQLYFDPTRTTARAWWEAEHGRWAAMTARERQRALAELLLSSARVVSADARDARVAELARLYSDAGVPMLADFEPLLGLLAGESVFGPRAERLCELARIALGVAGQEDPESEPRERLIDFVLGHFGPEADESLARVARDLVPESLRLLAARPDPRARALAAQGLVRLETSEPELRALLHDPEPSVAAATLAALASSPLALARAHALEDELLARARSPLLAQRMAALGVLARIGSAAVNDLALEAVGDPDPALQLAGVAALAELAEPRSASLFASLLARGPDSPLFLEARRGLARLGPVGLDECLRLARSSGVRARREAILLLSERLAPEAAGLVLALLTEAPEERLVWELSVLSGLDLAAEQHPEQAGWAWWDLVVHDDPDAWLLAAAERARVPTPSRDALVGAEGERALTPAGARFLLQVAELEAPQLVERAARELELRLGTEIRRPEGAAQRARFLEELREAVQARYGE